MQTFVPIVRLPQALRQEETRLAEQEEVALQALRRATSVEGNEVLLPYGFLADRVPVRSPARRPHHTGAVLDRVLTGMVSCRHLAERTRL